MKLEAITARAGKLDKSEGQRALKARKFRPRGRKQEWPTGSSRKKSFKKIRTNKIKTVKEFIS